MNSRRAALAPGGFCENTDSVSLLCRHPGGRPRLDLLGQRAPCADHIDTDGPADPADAGYATRAADAADFTGAFSGCSAGRATDANITDTGSDSGRGAAVRSQGQHADRGGTWRLG